MGHMNFDDALGGNHPVELAQHAGEGSELSVAIHGALPDS
jgi:hypothetical protein